MGHKVILMSNSLQHSPLQTLHEAKQGKFVPFVNWSLPISYPSGIVAEYQHTRNECSLFDVSHMCQMKLSGTDSAAVIEKLAPVRTKLIKANRSKYTIMCNENGGILDDMIISCEDETSYLIICNASRAEVIFNHINSNLSGDAKLERLSEQGLLALQGPKAINIAKKLFPYTEVFNFLDSNWFSFQNEDIRICRCGYTGEDGFEFSAPYAVIQALAEELLSFDYCQLAGLGARDLLRLEAGLYLYGQDITEDTTPIEAKLNWAIPKSLRCDGDYLGANTVIKQINEGVDKTIVGLKLEQKSPARKDMKVFANDEEIGVITSGNYSPILNYSIAFAYIKPEYINNESKLFVEIRNNKIACEFCAVPFIQPHYVKQSKGENK